MEAFSDAVILCGKNFGKAVGALIAGQENHTGI